MPIEETRMEPEYPEEIPVVVAERVLEFRSTPAREITVKIGRPEPHGDDWACPFQILGFDRRHGLRAYGVDPFQALLLAIRAVSAELDAAARREGGCFTWLGEPGDGFPKVWE
jgi:hypothetical protein